MGIPLPPYRRASPRGGRLGARRALACAALTGALAGLCAADTRAVLPVSATVNPVARIDAAVPAPLQISAADVLRGYLDVPHALRLRVYSNSRAGFALDVASQSPWFTAVAIEGLDAPVTLGAEGGTIVQRWQGAATREVDLHVRFRLAAGLMPGLYAWPLQFHARPL
ncbi:MAG TPA: hypothetical protein VMT49_03645 [Steroidobacteraceae bacterium]|nr:hypothetical protein [Steroidobacteraceae bacterium]